MPDQKMYQTVIKITGAVDPKMLADLKKMGANISQISGESKKLKKESKEAFGAMAFGADIAKGAVGQLKAAMGELLLPLVAIASLVKGVTWGKDEMSEGAEKAQKLREQMTLLKGVLEGTDLVYKHGYSADALMGKFLAGSEQMAKDQGNLYGKGFYTNVQTTLAEAGLGYDVTKQIGEKLTGFAAMKKGTILGLTADDVNEYSNMVKTAFTTGNLGRNARVFGLDAEKQKEFKQAYAQGNTLLMERILLSGKYFQESDAFMKRSLSGPEAELQKARTAHTAAQVKAGKSWLEGQEKIETSVLDLETAFDPVLGQLGDIANSFMPEIESAFKWVSGEIPQWDRDFQQFIKNNKQKIGYNLITYW